MDMLGHTLMPFCSACRQFFGFIPASAHILQISSDNVHLILSRPSRLPLVSQFTAWRGILESSIVNTCPNHLGLLCLMMTSNFLNTLTAMWWFEGHKSASDSDKGENEVPTEEIVPPFRRECHSEVYCGSHVYPGRGVYLLKFDNSYSLWRSKTLYYRVYYTP